MQNLINHFRVKSLFGFKLGIFGVEHEEGNEATLEEKSILMMSLSLKDKNIHSSSSSGNCHSKDEDNPKFSQIKTARPEFFPSFLHFPFPPL